MGIIDKILDWPIIVQGALGSLLFFSIYKIGYKLSDLIFKKLSGDQEIGFNFANRAHKDFYKGNFEFSNYGFFVAIYAGLHYFIKFVIVIFIGFLLEKIVPVFGYIGYTIGFYFLYRAICYLPHFDRFNHDEIEKIIDSYKKIDEKHKKDEKEMLDK